MTVGLPKVIGSQIFIALFGIPIQSFIIAYCLLYNLLSYRLIVSTVYLLSCHNFKITSLALSIKANSMKIEDAKLQVFGLGLQTMTAELPKKEEFL